MPFTFSHPAIVLPLAYLPRQWFSLTGLVIGSMTPDFEYFLRMRIQSNYSHTVDGLFWFDLPLGLLLTFIFHNIVRDSLFDNVPKFLRSRLLIFKNLDWIQHFKKNWLIVLVSIFLGAASHIFWDSFTHGQGYFARTIPFLTSPVDLLNRQIPNFKILQHLSTGVGGLVIAFALFKLPKAKNVSGRVSLRYWSIFTLLTVTIISLRLLSGLEYKAYGHLIITSISAGLISLALTPMLIRAKV